MPPINISFAPATSFCSWSMTSPSRTIFSVRGTSRTTRSLASVATFRTHQWLVMLGSIAVYVVGWLLNFPRRSTWDAWASSAGLTLPW